MLLFLSDYKNGGKTDFYTYDYNNTTKYEFEGDQTNDAPTKCLIKISHKHKHPIDTIICIVSEEVFTKRIAPANQTAFERFKAMIDEHCSEEYPDDDYKINIIPIGYNFEIPIDTNNTQDPVPESEKRHPSIYQKIEKELGLNYKTENIIYIDYTGGFRNINLLMIALIRYLEFKGIVCRDIIYSDFFSTPKAIRNIRYIYDMFDMINGVSEFVGTGNARQLIALQGETTNSNIVKTFVKTLQDFSNAIAICDVSKIQTTIESISTAINTLEQDTSDDIFVQMFKTLIPTVKEKLYIGKEPPSILDLSQWCLENNMLQQAVTIYNEKILLHYYEHYPAFIAKFSDEKKKKKKIDNGKVKDLCKDFNDSIICNSFKEAIEALKNGNTDNITEDTESNYNILIDVIKKNWNIDEFRNYLLNKTDGTEVNREYKKVEEEFKNISSNDATIVLDFLEKQENLLWRAMKYYHAVRIIRNNINHVSDDMRNMNKTMQQYLEKKGLGDTAIAAGETFEFKLEKDFISKTLEAAIEFSKEICKN